MTSMIAQCPSCLTEFELDPNKVPITGLRARCSVCSAVIVVPAATVALQRDRMAGPQSGSTYQTVHHGVHDSVAVVTPETHASPTVTPTTIATTAVTTPETTSGSGTGAHTDENGGVHHIDARSHVIAADPDIIANTTAPAVSTESTPASDEHPVTSAGFDTTVAATSTASTGTPHSDAARPVEAPRRKPVNPFLTRDPALRAKRLARALVSDIVAYHPAKHAEGVRDGTLKTLFHDEIRKSYEEYVDQVGREFAETTTHFRDALNDVLAGGRKQF